MPPFDETLPQDSQHLSSLAEEIYLMRRARDREMPSELFGEPAWDMLLALYRENDPALTMDALHLVSGIPESTAVRWVAALQCRGLVERARPGDQNLDLVSLTGEGRRILERSLGAMLRILRPAA